MRRAVVGIGLLLLAMVVFGPRARLSFQASDAASHPIPEDLEDLARFVAGQSDGLEDLVEGTEARIIWSSSTAFSRTEWSVVHLHGFSATRQESAPLAERVAEELGAHLYEARYRGHGQSGEALAQARAEDWIRDTREAIQIGRRLGRRVVVLAVSTGATMATLVAAHDHPEVEAYVLLSPNFGPKDPSAQLLLWPWAEVWIPWAVGAERSWEPENEAHGRYWTHRYPVRALFPMMATVAAVRSAPVETIEPAVHMFFSPEDPTVDPKHTQAVFGRLTRSREKSMTPVDGPGDAHVLAGRILSPERTEPMVERILARLRGEPAHPAP